MKKIGFVGARGMIGSTLLERMKSTGVDKMGELFFFSSEEVVELKKMDIVVSCRGSEYSKKVYGPLRQSGWKGFWLDAASLLRMEKDSCLVLDPINLPLIKKSLKEGIKTFVGANCTVSLMMMALAGLFKNNLIEMVNSDTYQGASGAGAKGLMELVDQMNYINPSLDNSSGALEVEEKIRERMLNPNLPQKIFKSPLVSNVLPWIDRAEEKGQSREEWKGAVECNKILGRNDMVVDGTCVRVPQFRCHAQSFTIKLTKDLPLKEIEEMLANAHPWVEVVPNTPRETINAFSTAKVSDSLTILVGRIRKSLWGEKYLKAFSMGDQILWGGAEPLCRTLSILVDN